MTNKKKIELIGKELEKIKDCSIAEDALRILIRISEIVYYEVLNS